MTPLDWDVIAPMIVSIVFFVTVGGVVLLRPLSKQIGSLLEAMTKEKLQGAPLQDQMSQIRELLEAQNQRLHLLEERLDFTEALLERSKPERLSPPGDGSPQEPTSGKGDRNGD